MRLKSAKTRLQPFSSQTEVGERPHLRHLDVIHSGLLSLAALAHAHDIDYSRVGLLTAGGLQQSESPTQCSSARLASTQPGIATVTVSYVTGTFCRAVTNRHWYDMMRRVREGRRGPITRSNSLNLHTAVHSMSKFSPLLSDPQLLCLSAGI